MGDSVEMKGPLGKFDYKPNMKKHFVFLAAGTGITPCLQVAQAIIDNPNDVTKITIVYCNKTEKDILCREELEEMRHNYPGYVKLHYVVENPFDGFGGHTGFLSKEIATSVLPSPSMGENVMVGVCGPPGFYTAVSGGKAPDWSQGEVDGILKDLGFSKDQVFKF